VNPIFKYLETSAGKHLLAVVLLAVAVFVGRSWLQEHDARLISDMRVKAAESTITTLEKQQSQVVQAAKVQVIQLKQEAKAVNTPSEALTALPQVESVPLEAVALPDAPGRAAVDIVPLYQSLNTCKQDAVNLAACGTELSLEKQITGEKDIQIAALKKKPGFFKRLGKAAKVIACAGAGGAAGAYLKGGEGAAIGAAAGAGIGQAF
jgi:hypothetical protein